MSNMELYDTTPVMQQKQVGTEMAISRQAQEVQAAMVIAKRFPRDEIEAQTRILQACERIGLAEKAEYSYPRGGEKVNGPSIRLAEVLQRCWGNMDSGIIELEQRNGESTMMAYCWDLESNTRTTRIFTQKHERKTKKAGITKLDDPRDIYELTANMGARRVRACILAQIPGDVVEMAQAKCRKTLEKGDGRPLVDRIRDMVLAFGTFSVTKEMLESYIGYSADKFAIDDLKKLTPIFTAIKDGIAKREDYFDIPGNNAPPSQAEQDFKASQQHPEPEPEPEKPKRGKKNAEQAGGDANEPADANQGQLL